MSINTTLSIIAGYNDVPDAPEVEFASTNGAPTLIVRAGNARFSVVLAGDTARQFGARLRIVADHIASTADALVEHPPVTLAGGDIPAHEPGAYPRLGCCGGPVVLVG